MRATWLVALPVLLLGSCQWPGLIDPDAGSSATPVQAVRPGPLPPYCGTHAEVLREIRAARREEVIAIGVTSGGGLLEVLARPDLATWTITVTTPAGITCVVTYGDNWRPELAGLRV